MTISKAKLYYYTYVNGYILLLLNILTVVYMIWYYVTVLIKWKLVKFSKVGSASFTDFAVCSLLLEFGILTQNSTWCFCLGVAWRTQFYLLFLRKQITQMLCNYNRTLYSWKPLNYNGWQLSLKHFLSLLIKKKGKVNVCS